MNAWPNREHTLKKLCDKLYVTSGTNSADLTMKGYVIFFREMLLISLIIIIEIIILTTNFGHFSNDT